MACLTFRLLNGTMLPVDDDENIATWLALATGALEEATLADWPRARIRPLV